jgi:hypothetical protein
LQLKLAEKVRQLAYAQGGDTLAHSLLDVGGDPVALIQVREGNGLSTEERKAQLT